MSKKTKEEKLNILHGRLAEIKEKNTEKKETQNKLAEDINSDNNNNNNNLEQKSYGKKIWFWILLIPLIVTCIFILKNKDKLSQVENTTNKDNNVVNDFKSIIQYNFDYKGDNIVLLEKFKNENSAKAYVNDLNIKGFRSSYFYLPNKSDSKEKVFVVFIGPYDSKEEANQWIKNIKTDYSIIKL